MTKENHPAAEENKHVVELLNELLESTRDAEFGFQACTDEAATPELQQLFRRRVEQCHQAADELVQLIWRFAGKPVEGGGAGGATRPGWMRIKGAVRAASDRAMLEECQRREDAALARYDKALAQSLPPDVRSFLERQASGARQSHDRIRGLLISGKGRGLEPC